MGCTTGGADLGQGEKVTWMMRARTISCMMADCKDENRGRVCLATGWKKGPRCRDGWVLEERCRASWESDVSILAQRIFRGERKMLYLSQYSIAVVALLA